MLLALSVALAIVPSASVAQQKIEQRRAVMPDASIRISGAFGALRIIGWERDSMVLTGVLGKGARFEGGFGGGGAAPARGVKMFIEATGDQVAGGRLELRVPARARVWAKGGSAKIEVTGITGGVDLNIIGGSVRVSGEPRELNVESMDGKVTIDGRPSWLRAKTATGDIELRGGGEDVGVSTISGAIRVGDAAGSYERAKLETVTGSIVFAGALARGASVSFDTHSGPIELRLPAKSSAEVDALTVTGTIENALTSRPAIAGREGRGQEIGLTIGDGDARIVLRSFKGNIQLRSLGAGK